MTKKGTVGKIYEISRRVRQGKKLAMQPTAVSNPATGRLAVTRKEIKSCSLQYCKDTLKNNPAEPGFERLAEVKEKLQERRLLAGNGHFMAGTELFEKVLKKFKLSGKKNYDFLNQPTIEQPTVTQYTVDNG